MGPIMQIATFLSRHTNSQVHVIRKPRVGEIFEAFMRETLGAWVQLLLDSLAVQVDVWRLGAFGLRALLADVGAAQQPLTQGRFACLGLGVLDILGARLSSKHGNDARSHPDWTQWSTFDLRARL